MLVVSSSPMRTILVCSVNIKRDDSRHFQFDTTSSINRNNLSSYVDKQGKFIVTSSSLSW